MAKILLNVELETKTYEAQLKAIKEQLDQTFSDSGNFNGGIGGGVKAAKAQVESLQKSFANLLNTLKGSESKYAEKTFEKLKTKITDCLNAAKDLNAEMGDEKATEEQKAEYKRLRKELSTLSTAFATTRVESEKLEKQNKLAIPNVDNLRKKYANLLSTIKNQEQYYKKGTFSGLVTDIKNNLDALKQLDPTTENYAETVNNLDKELNRLSADFAETKSSAKNFHGSLGEIVKGFVKFQASAMLVMKPLQLIREAWADINETLVETETRVIELQRVAGKAANSDELYALAQKYGQTFDNVSEITLNFARNGMDWAESLKATEAALLAINVAELDATQASEGMIAIMNQFGLSASDLESVVDKLNITADKAAVSTEKLLTALQRTGSSAKNANLTLEETVGIVTALSEATGRSGENLGTAVNSLIQFSTKSTALDTFAKLGGSVEKAVEDYRMGAGTVLDIWRELSTIVKNSSTSSEGILSVLFGDDDWRSLNEELQTELGDNFATVTEIYDTASTFRKNYFIALLQNLDQVQETVETMKKSEGYSQDENLQYLDTYEARLNKLQSKWKEIANDEQGLLGIKKIVIGFASDLLDILENIGGIKGVLQTTIAIASPFLVQWGITFGTKALSTAVSGIKSFWAACRAGALSTNAALGAIGVILGVVSTISNVNYSNQQEALEKQASSISEGANALSSLQDTLDKTASDYDALITKIKTYREILDSEATSTTEKETAQSKLLTIQNDLIESNNLYANSLDLINGKLENQVDLLEKSKIENLRTQIQDYIDKNTPTEQASKDYLNSFQDVIFDEATDSYHLGTLYKFLKNKGYDVSDDLVTGSGWDRVTASLGAVFGADTLHTMFSYAYHPEYIVNNLLPSIIEAIKASDYSDDDKTYLMAQVQSLLDDYGEGSTYDQAIKYIYGDSESEDFISSLSLEQRKNIANGLISDEDLIKLWNEFYGIDSTSTGSSSSSNKTNLSDVVNKLEEIRENTEKTKELEEKQLALEEAKNQRTVRVFNAETGQWEMQANEKDIASAENDLKETALDTIQEYLSTDEAQEKLNNGEFTLPEWLVNMLAQPTTDDKFKAFMSAMGIMSGVINTPPSSSGIIYNNSATTNNNNNSTYNYNGIPISNEMANSYTVAQLAELFGQIE